MDDDPSSAASQDGRDDDDEEEYEEAGGGNRLLGFMFGNVDDSGDLDVDYLDEEAKEHLGALADKLGPSLTDIDLIKSSASPDVSEQDYDEKAEDAIDFEDIDEQYDGPEIQSSTEEDHLLPKKDYFSSAVVLASLEQKGSVFDEENYDEDEETIKETEVLENHIKVAGLPSTGEQLEISSEHATPHDGSLFSGRSPETNDMAFELEGLQENSNIEQAMVDVKSETSLPVLCVEEGMVILKFSEIFGIHKPLRKAERKEQHRHSISKERLKAAEVIEVEEDEEVFLRSSCHDLSNIKHQGLTVSETDADVQLASPGAYELTRDSCLSAQPMKDDSAVDVSACQWSSVTPEFYPFDQHDWETAIIWGNSPTASHGFSESRVISELDAEGNTDAERENCHASEKTEINNKDLSLLIDPVLIEPLGSRNFPHSAFSSLDKNYHPQLLRLESLQEKISCSAEAGVNNQTEEAHRGYILHRFNKLSLQNEDLLNGSWLDQVIWDPDEAVPKPKLILDLQDEQMLFEIFDHKDSDHLRSRSGAMVMIHPRTHAADSSDFQNHGTQALGRFNFSNDKYYSNRKISQQAKSHAKKRSLHGIKVMHSVPALKLQTMKLKLSNKDVANFHRPKALWYPRDNQVFLQEQGMLCTSGPIKIIVTTLGGGKGIKLQINAEETLAAVKFRASKKLDFRPQETVKVFYSGKELEDDRSLAQQNVRPNSVLHLVRTKVHIWPKAQKLPGDNKPLRPPGAFKKKSDLSVKDGHVFLMEYCEERPLLLGNVGMGARLCTYYQKTASSDQTASSLRNSNNGLGTVIPLEPSDKSPFLGDIGSGCSQSCIETNMYRSPIFPQKSSSTDYLLVRSAKGMLSLRRIDKLYSVGQQEPHMEVLSPGSKTVVQTYLVNRMLVHVYREFHANEKPDVLPSIRYEDLNTQFTGLGLTDAIIRKRMKHCADLKKGKNGKLSWVKRRDFRVPSEDELRRMLAPENVCSYESMQAGLYRLKRLGITRLTLPAGLPTAMNQLPDEAIALAAASHIERELQITPWNLTGNFLLCTNQGKENIEKLEITGVGDPSGRGLGFSYVRVTPKAPISSSVMKKKTASAKAGAAVTGTDADLRRLSMDAAREVLLKFNVPDEQIDKLTRWHRIALVRKLSSEQAESGVKVDAMTLSKFARGQRMSFLQLQQQTREKCQEIWDRQVQSLSAADGDEVESDSEANSDLDSFAGDLENLLDAEEFDDEDGNIESRGDKTDVVRGLKMRRCSPLAQTGKESDDEKAEAALLLRLLDDDEDEIKKMKKPSMQEIGYRSQPGPESADFFKKTNHVVRSNIKLPYLGVSFGPKEMVRHDSEEGTKLISEAILSAKVKPKKINEKNDGVSIGIVYKKTASTKDGLKVFKEKKLVERPSRENFVCGACGQHGHMRTNKNCPKYGEDVEALELETVSIKAGNPDAGSQPLKTPSKKLIPKALIKMAEPEVSEGGERANLKSSSTLKFKCGSSEKIPERNVPSSQVSDVQSVEVEPKSIKLKISSNTKSEEPQVEISKPSVVIRPPVNMEREQPVKKIIIKQLKAIGNIGQINEVHDLGMEYEYRKTKKIAELSSSEKQRKHANPWSNGDDVKGKAVRERLWGEERKSKQRIAEERTWKLPDESMQEQQRLIETSRSGEAIWRDENKSKKKKKKKPDFGDEYLLEHKQYRNDRRIPEMDRPSKRRPTVDSGQLYYAPPTKRRRGAEVLLSNVLEGIVDTLRANTVISCLFLKPVTKKEAPDYFDIIDKPMDLSTIRDKVRNMEYKNKDWFRHDVWQITYNAHRYNDGRNPGIPPLADQLLELCDFLLEEKNDILTEAESGIERDK